MNDRELLELAAKAAGFSETEWQDLSGWGAVRYGFNEAIWTGKDYWNPLQNDKDALRLAVKLYLWDAIRLAHRDVTDTVDIYAATRRAVVRAAAEVGKGMK